MLLHMAFVLAVGAQTPNGIIAPVIVPSSKAEREEDRTNDALRNWTHCTRVFAFEREADIKHSPSEIAEAALIHCQEVKGELAQAMRNQHDENGNPSWPGQSVEIFLSRLSAAERQILMEWIGRATRREEALRKQRGR